MFKCKVLICLLLTVAAPWSHRVNGDELDKDANHPSKREEYNAPNDGLPGPSGPTSLERNEGITKSPHDKCAYRGLKLKNDLNVLIITDPTTITSAASLVVRVGALNDPEPKSGIAYLLERVLLSSKCEERQPEDSFEEFVRAHYGDLKTVTYEHKQSFSFEIEPEMFLTALRRFSGFFTNPLSRCFRAVEKEIQKKTSSLPQRQELNERLRILQVEKLLSQPDHPFNHFLFAENEDPRKYPSLRDSSVVMKLRAFHSEWYSSNVMCLVVLGTETLDEMEKQVKSLFETVPNKQVRKLTFSYDEHPWGPEQLKRKVYIVPKADVQLLRLVFPAPNVLDEEMFTYAPEIYVSDLLHQKGPGSLFSAIRKEDFCEDITAEYENNAGIAFFSISCYLTNRGIEDVDSVVNLIFQYLHFLYEDGIQEQFFNETKMMDKLAFFYNDNVEWDMLPYVESLASSMHDYPVNEVLSFELFRDAWKPAVIKTFLNYLTPKNVNISIVGKTLVHNATETEPWFETNYGVEKIPESLIKKWETRDSTYKFHLPPPNEFTAVNFETIPLPEDESEHPYVIQDSSISRIWFKQDGKFGFPILHVHFEIFCPIIRFDLSYRALAQIYVEMLKNALKKNAHAAEKARLTWNLELVELGLEVNLSGYNDKLPALLERIMSILTNFQAKLNEERFIKAKNKCLRTLKKFYGEDSYVLAEGYSKHLFTESGWPIDDNIAAVESCKYEDLKRFVPKLFSRVLVHGLIHGNCSKENATDIVDTIEEPFRESKVVLPQQLMQPRVVKIDDGSHFTFEAVSSALTSFNYYQASYQLDTEAVRNNIIYSLFSTIVESINKKALAGLSRYHSLLLPPIEKLMNVSAFLIAAESEDNPYHMDTDIEKHFWQKLSYMLELMTDARYNARKSALRTKMEREKSAHHLKTLSDVYWKEIRNRFYNFDRTDMELFELDTIDKSEVIAFFKDYLDSAAPKRRKLAVHIYPETHLMERVSYADMPSNVVPIQDIVTFKNARTLLPHTAPYMTSVTPLGTQITHKNSRWALFRQKSTLSRRLRDSVSATRRETPLRKIASMSKENTGIMLPGDLRPFDNQVGGHAFLQEKATKGIMKDADGNILKPIPHSGPGEIYFYEMLKRTEDPILVELKELVPQYLGTMKIKFENEGDITCLRMKDVTMGFKFPCIMDIKLGVQTWEPTAPRDKIERKKGRFTAVKDNLGFGIPGFRYYDVVHGNTVKEGKDFCKTMSPERAIQEIYKFLNGEIGIKYGLIDVALIRLRKLYSWFERQRKFYFFSSSVLMTYDAQKLISFAQNKENDSEVAVHDEPKIKVYFIDFAHAISNPGNVDSNCLNSLRNLIYLLENLTAILAKSLRETVSLPKLMKVES